MSTVVTWQTNSTNSDATERLGQQLGRALKGGELIELKSDLGGGKTTFTRGLVAGLESSDQVASPSFTISKVYSTKHHLVHHFDFYRLSEPGLMANELAEVINDPDAIVVVEWADVVQDILPAERLSVEIKNQGENKRQLTFKTTEKLNYLIEALK